MSYRALEKLTAATVLIEQTSSTGAKKLNLAWRGLQSLPDSITELSHLTELCLTGNQLRLVPDSIYKLSSLQSLDLSKNQIEHVSDSIGDLKQLRSLDLSNNQLADITDCIGSLTELEQLDLSRNFLTRVPQSIGQLIHLTELFLSNNPLTELPDSLGELYHLRHLELYYGLLSKLPESIGRLRNLMRLYLLSNRLTELPGSIGSLSFLHELDLGGNLLTDLPECIGQLTQLRSLDLSRNQLKKLPTSIGRLTQLRTLDVSQNQLMDLPQSLGDLKRLKEFYLTGNSVLAIPTEILDASSGSTRQSVKPLEILRYYSQIRRGKQPLNEAKLILIGRGGVGKTSIVNRLVHNDFNCNETKTDGIRITEWKVKLKATDDVRLNIWDFGGQEIMHATHQFFLTKRSLYIVVISGREGNEDAEAEYWLKLVEAFGGESPVIVVLNKIVEHPFDLNRRWLQQKYPAIKYFVKTDCRDNVGIDELRAVLEFETDRLDHLRDAFPVSWFGIKDQLSGMKSNYLSFEEYRRFCTESGEGDLTAQNALASYLHNLGIVLNYKDDPRLQDTHVLNPHWVTNGIYKILNSERLERQKGEIYLTEVSEILDPSEYPMQMCRFIFDLMKKFDLCFSFPNDEAHYLIPELLDKQEPEEAITFKPEECLNFQYHYPILPEGLLPRFIVRTHILSAGPNCMRWRTGVILEFEDCRALVKSDPQDKKVFISITGPNLSRRRLLAIIRADFASIHRAIQNLQPQEMVPVAKHPDVIVPYEDLALWESNGRATYSVRAAGKILDLGVQEMLNGVDLELRGGKIGRDRYQVRLFYSYSHKDESLRNELETHLKLMHREHLLSAWHDRKIEAGDDWRKEIDGNLESADIILLLVSPDFIASDYCYEIEMARALERHAKGEARVIPIIVRDVALKHAPFGDLQAVPKDGKAVTLWDNRDSAWRSVSDEIERVIDSFESNSSHTAPSQNWTEPLD